ncbi:MAG: ABC transporter ATP-binding protein [Gemmatimonadetes bacterium]|nr:ABC transporter ATP-binding protein [Gemmatimonadota bacterium]
MTFGYGSASASVVQVDLEVCPGEIVGLVGRNGAGKSTLLRLLMGELTPTEGTVMLPSPRGLDGRVAIGYVGEETAHFEAISGLDNACFFARAAGLGRRAASEAVAEHVNLLGLNDEAADRVSTYSFGARRKLLLVEALAHRPRLVLLDEPTAGLDAGSRDALARLLRVRRGEGSGVAVASHDLHFLTDIADRIVVVHRGRVIAEGPLHELLATVGSLTRLEITLEARPDRLPEDFGPEVELVRDGKELVLETTRGQAALPDVWTALVAAGARISGVVVREPGLAEVFRHFTGEELDS